jgi:hypothetical protein
MQKLITEETQHARWFKINLLIDCTCKWDDTYCATPKRRKDMVGTVENYPQQACTDNLSIQLRGAPQLLRCMMYGTVDDRHRRSRKEHPTFKRCAAGKRLRGAAKTGARRVDTAEK